MADFDFFPKMTDSSSFSIRERFKVAFLKQNKLIFQKRKETNERTTHKLYQTLHVTKFEYLCMDSFIILFFLFLYHVKPIFKYSSSSSSLYLPSELLFLLSFGTNAKQIANFFINRIRNEC